MKLLLCLATLKGLAALDSALATVPARSLAVCTFAEPLVAHSYHVDILERAAAAGVEVVEWHDFQESPRAFLEARGISGILCIGWRYLVAASAIDHLQGNVVAAHDSLLPKLRGFAPLPTALIAGETETGVSFIRVGQAADDGDIVWQGRVAIEPGDTIQILIDKTLPLYRQGTALFCRGELGAGTPQEERLATYSIWRDADDYRIDWQWDAELIARSVRALGPPYLGARTRLKGADVVIEKANVVPDLTFAIRQPGKVWRIDEGGCPVVVCGRGLLRIEAATAEGSSILPFRSLRVRFR